MAKKSKTDENDFNALDRLAKSITPDQLRPLTPAQQGQWGAAKRGRPKKPPGTKAVPTLITVEPQLLRRADAYAKKSGLSRSQLFSDAMRRRIARSEMCQFSSRRPAMPHGGTAHPPRRSCGVQYPARTLRDGILSWRVPAAPLPVRSRFRCIGGAKRNKTI